eukprot:5523014-Prymnesium_polylepis.1
MHTPQPRPRAERARRKVRGAARGCCAGPRVRAAATRRNANVHRPPSPFAGGEGGGNRTVPS